MTRTIRTDIYYYIYSNDKEDIIWYSPASDDKKKQDYNLRNCLEEARKILCRNSSADIQIYGRATDMCDEYEDGEEYDFLVADPDGFNKLEQKLKGKLM